MKRFLLMIFGFVIALSMLSLTAFASSDVRLGAITADSVNVRSDASTDSEIVGRIDSNTAVAILDSKGQFYLVRWKNIEGYVSDDFVAVYASKSGKVTADNVIVREEASRDSDKVTTLDKGDGVNVYGEKNGFYRVSCKDGIGFISTDYVSVGDTKASKSSDGKTSEKEKNDPQNYSRKTDVGNYSADELELVARLIYAEGKTQSSRGFEAMSSVVYNRLVSKKFPKSIEAIVFQDNQFSVTRNREKFDSLVPNKKARAAVNTVFVEGNVSLPPEVMYFKSARLSRDWGSSRVYYDTIDGNMYYS